MKRTGFIQRLINRWQVIPLPWRRDRFVGYDLDGNMYFEGPPIREGTHYPRRRVAYADGREHFDQYEPNSIPVQWQAWMRHTRPAEPTIQELIASEEQKQRTLQLAHELDRQWDEQRAQLAKAREDLQQLAAGERHTTASSDAVGQGETFQPGSWTPPARPVQRGG
ncbi:uncharacterized protein BJ171DRAFT_535092 [Polychytrium aggregatum]|uniref:uncharacterized protein n=1 Tax=Polychytrium aggregatum TaxID=110093 RepID=UPI0022FE4E08|nr:uncharacterized protein BJ171DRAFT_535092 [Polychytrium aggregatum]KAI9193039.1 hypothetical protein BJ171DRAFT_535092 [Polychytrium aggregatum]